MRAQRQKVKLLQQAGADPEAILLEKCKYQAQLDEYKAFRRWGLKSSGSVSITICRAVAPSREVYQRYLQEGIDGLGMVDKSQISQKSQKQLRTGQRVIWA